MKKIIVLAALVGALFLGYKNRDRLSFSDTGAFDENGKAKVVVFTMAPCPPCDQVVADLRERNVAFEQIDIMTDEGRGRIEKYGKIAAPLVVIGNRQVWGNNLIELESALAEGMGAEALSPAVERVMQSHFDEQGKPRVVMYGSSTCGYCRRMREHMDEKKIPYIYREVMDNNDARADFTVLRGRGVPLTFVGYRRIDGFSLEKLDELVKELL